MKENTTTIRVKKDDKQIWKEYCQAIGMPSQRLFNKIVNSKDINLKNRVSNEIKNKYSEFEKRFMKRP